MAQVTIYLDEDNLKRLKAAAQAEGVPVSRWVANLIEEKAATSWPESVRCLAGAWSDFPELRVIRQQDGRDSKREAL